MADAFRTFGSGWAGEDVHWMKIDVEGMEADVLRGWDATLLRPWILLIEATRPNSPEPCHEHWEPMVLAAGYHLTPSGRDGFLLVAEQQAYEAPSRDWYARWPSPDRWSCMRAMPTNRFFFRLLVAAIALWQSLAPLYGEVVAPTLARPQDQSRFRVSVFATGLGYPTSMAQLADGSLLVATSAGGTSSWLNNYIFSSPSGALVRLADADGDGVADGPAQPVATGLPGLVTTVRREGNLVFALSAQPGSQAITIWRTGSTAGAPLEAAGRLSFSLPVGFQHPPCTLTTRPAPGGGVELFFNVGSAQNAQSTPAEQTVGLTASAGAAFVSGSSFQLAADSVHRIIVTDDASTVTIGGPQHIARGLRNAAGMVFDSQGNLWLQDNGIDGIPATVSLSADELNFIPAADIGASVPDFGFAGTYVDYASGDVIGPTAGVVQPRVAFRPIAGEKSEGVVELAIAPASFPSDFAGGIFAPFSGVFNQGGLANDENPLVFVNTADNTYFHFIENQRLGHPNGLLSATDGLYVSDLNYLGLFGNPVGSNPLVPADQQGVIYKITYVPEPKALWLALLGLAGLFAQCSSLRRRPSAP